VQKLEATQIATGGTPIRGVIRRLGRIVGRTSWAVIDQGLFSFSNFAANLVLALWLTPAEFGGYIAATAVFWIAVGVHSGLLIQPMMVFGSGRFHDRPSTYLAILTGFHWCVAAMISAALAVGGLSLIFLGSASLGWSILGYAVGAPLVLLQPLLRQTFYIWSHPRLAAAASTIYMGGTFAIVYALYRSATLSSFTTPLAAAGASAVSIAGMIAVRRVPLSSPRGGAFVREVAAAHWRYGRWAVVTGIVDWTRGSIYYLVVPVLVGLEANAALNVLRNLAMPALQAYLAASALLIPAFSRRARSRRVASLMWPALIVLVAGGAVYALLVGLFGGTLIELIYRGRYTKYADLAWLMGLLVVPTAASTTFGSFLRADEKPDRVLSAYVAATVVACVGIIAIYAWGLLGAVLGLLASSATTVLVMLWCVLRTEIVPVIPRSPTGLPKEKRAQAQ
jgi:O-antigen/teichoic acid export membrane protein